MSEALVKIDEGLQKINHKSYDGLMIKVKILKSLNRYEEAQNVLKDMLEWHQDKKEEIL